MRLIDADALIEAFSDLLTDGYVATYRSVESRIALAPTVDAVLREEYQKLFDDWEPVVRCEECKWGKFHTHIPPWTHWCVRDPKEAPSKQAKDFCSYGEKAGDAE